MPNFGTDFSWWTQLGLIGMLESSPDEQDSLSFGMDLLKQYEPSGFNGPDGAQVSLRELTQLVRDARAAEHEAFLAQAEAERERQRELGWEKVAEAFAAHDAAEPITSGVWEGLNRGQAFAWAWTLAQYVPSRGNHPAVLVHQRNLRALKEGKLPEYSHYGKLAKQYESDGMDVKAYRRAREVLGDKPYPID